MMMMMMTKLKRKGVEQRLLVFNGEDVKQSGSLENIGIDVQENTKMCVKNRLGRHRLA